MVWLRCVFDVVSGLNVGFDVVDVGDLGVDDFIVLLCWLVAVGCFWLFCLMFVMYCIFNSFGVIC